MSLRPACRANITASTLALVTVWDNRKNYFQIWEGSYRALFGDILLRPKEPGVDPGVTVVIITKALLAPETPQPCEALMKDLGLSCPPAVFNYDSMAVNNSFHNALNIFDVYIIGQVLKQLLKDLPGKIYGQEALLKRKADSIYDTLDAHPASYRMSIRSRMSICFCVTNTSDNDLAERDFLQRAESLKLIGLAGHCSVGGIRVSNYNAVTLESVHKLAEFIAMYAATRELL